MNKLILFLICCLPLIALGQNTNDPILGGSKIDGVHFDEIEVREIVNTTDEQKQVYFNLSKNVLIQNKSNPKKQKVGKVEGIGQIILNAENEAVSEKFIIFRPKSVLEKALLGEYRIMNGIKKNSPVLVEDNQTISQNRIQTVFADLPKDDTPMARMYYNNSLSTKTMWGKTDGIKVEKNELKKSSLGSKYVPTQAEYVFGINNMSDKKADFWMPQEHDYLDEIRGYIFSIQGKVIKRDTRSTFKNRALMTFTPEGEVLNKFEMNTEVSKEPDLVRMMYNEVDGRKQIDGGIVLLRNKSTKVKKKKKASSTASIHAKDFYAFDENGQMSEQITFETEGDQFIYFNEYWKTGNQHRMLGRTGLRTKPPTIHYYASEDGKIIKKYSLGLDAAEFGGHNYSTKWFASYGIELDNNYDLEDGSELVVFRIKGTTRSIGQEESIAVNKGYLILMIDSNGDVVGSQAITRDMKKASDQPVTTNLYFKGMNGKVANWIMVDERPRKNQTFIYQAARVTTDLENKKTTKSMLIEDYNLINYCVVGEKTYLIGKAEKEVDSQMLSSFYFHPID
ncbi:MAG: hypothetical protein AAF573_22485 [Bacteroidota bacterium]